MIVVSIIDLEQKPKLFKPIMKKWNLVENLRCLGIIIAMGRICHRWILFDEFYKVHSLFKS